MSFSDALRINEDSKYPTLLNLTWEGSTLGRLVQCVHCPCRRDRPWIPV